MKIWQKVIGVFAALAIAAGLFVSTATPASAVRWHNNFVQLTGNSRVDINFRDSAGRWFNMRPGQVSDSHRWTRGFYIPRGCTGYSRQVAPQLTPWKTHRTGDHLYVFQGDYTANELWVTCP